MNKAEKETLLRRTAPSRQKQAQEYLQGRSPGAMQRYAPDDAICSMIAIKISSISLLV